MQQKLLEKTKWDFYTEAKEQRKKGGEVEAFLRKRDSLPDSEGKFSISMFQGRRVIVDDGLPKVNGTNVPAYTTYLFAPGAIAAGFAALDANEAVEMTRNVLASDDVLVNRRRFILHPRGVKCVGVPAGASPTNAELATVGNWSKVYQDKNTG